jgi:hypothetical protein
MGFERVVFFSLLLLVLSLLLIKFGLLIQRWQNLDSNVRLPWFPWLANRKLFSILWNSAVFKRILGELLHFDVSQHLHQQPCSFHSFTEPAFSNKPHLHSMASNSPISGTLTYLVSKFRSASLHLYSYQWLREAIPANRKEEAGPDKSKRPYLRNKLNPKKVKTVEHLSSKCHALSSIPVLPKNQKSPRLGFPKSYNWTCFLLFPKAPSYELSSQITSFFQGLSELLSVPFCIQPADHSPKIHLPC